jgi:hypothetical protein
MPCCCIGTKTPGRKEHNTEKLTFHLSALAES